MKKKNALALKKVLEARGKHVELVKSAGCADCWDLIEIKEPETPKNDETKQSKRGKKNTD